MREGLNQKLNCPSDILVFGASGAIGTAFLEKSKLSGMSVIGVSRGDPKDKSIISTDYQTTSVLEIIKTYSPKQIIISIGTASSNPNVDSTLINDEFRSIGSIISAIDQSNVSSHVSLLSSSAVYGDTKKELSSESDILNPISKYGESKAKIELLALQHSKNSSFTLDVLRVFSVYGKNQRKLLVWDMFERIQNRNEGKLVIKSSTKNKRNFIHIEDLALIIQIIALVLISPVTFIPI
jgi:nucleoside-diphosphate-sugar epimerase